MLTLLSLYICSEARADVTWESDFALAQKLSQRFGKPLFVDFMAGWCGPCKKMEKTTFRDAAVQKLLARCVCVRVDIDREPARAQKFGVTSIPRLMLTDSQGRRLLDALGYRPAETFRQELGDALRGKAVIRNGGPEKPPEPPEVMLLRAQVERGTYAAWKARSPSQAAKARALLVEQLGAFDAPDRDRAASLLAKLNEDAVDPLIAALDHAKLAVRVAAYDALARLLENRYQLHPASQPRYDAWAAAPERARLARAFAAWWAQRRSAGTSGSL